MTEEMENQTEDQVENQAEVEDSASEQPPETTEPAAATEQPAEPEAEESAEDLAQQLAQEPAEGEGEESETDAAAQAAEEPAEEPAQEPAQEPAIDTAAEEAPEESEPADEPEAQEQAEPVSAEAEATEGEGETPEEEVAEKKARVPRSRAPEPAVLPDEKASDIKWYVIHAHSGHENKVKQSLENRIRQEHLEDSIIHVLVPSEEVAEVKGGKKRVTSRKIFPGYVLVEMKLSHNTWYLVRTTPGVTGFIGSGKMPTPLEPEEMETIFEQMRGEQKKPKPKVEFEKDERVKIIEGPFSNFMGTVDEVNAERGKLKVMVEIFERLTSVELEFWQVEKS